jgi:putative FmdB family regulatory protein
MKDIKMATYVFKCKLCDRNFEISCPMDAVIGSTFYCPECGGEGKKEFFPIPAIFRGKGFYKTDQK